jgi:hypothetical protein
VLGGVLLFQYFHLSNGGYLYCVQSKQASCAPSAVIALAYPIKVKDCGLFQNPVAVDALSILVAYYYKRMHLSVQKLSYYAVLLVAAICS